MTRIPLLVAFLAGTLCGGIALRFPRPMPSPPAQPVARVWSAGVRTGWPGAVVDAVRHDVGGSAGQKPVRNLFAFLAPPPAPVEKPRVLPTAAVNVRMQPFVAEPTAPPPFPYRYIGTFGPRQNAFAVFAREGDVINVRVGDAVAERFRLRHIGLESVDLSWGGPSDLRVPLGR